ncbi:MAG: ATP-binding protein [Cytophagaceae bacterium]
MLDKYISVNISDNEELRYQQFVMFNDLTSITTAIFFLVYVCIDLPELAIILGVVTLISALNQWVFYYYKISYELSVNVFIGVHSLYAMISTIYYTGGISSVVMGWFLFPPVVALMLLKQRGYMYLWLSVSIMILSVYTWMYWVGLPTPNLFNEHNTIMYIYMMTHFSLFILVFAFSYYFLERELDARSKLEYIQSLLTTSNTSSGIGTWEYDVKTNITYFNKVSRDTLSLSQEYVKNGSLSNFIQTLPDTNLDLAQLVQEAQLNGDVFDIEIQIIVSKNTLRWVRIIGIPNKIEQECISIYGLIQDVTEQKERETEWQTLKHRAELNNAAKTSFVSKVSHELRTPLNVIIGFSNLFDVKQMTEEQIGYLKALQTSSNTLHQLITEVLDFSSDEAVQKLPEPRPTVIRKLVQDVVSLFKLDVEKASIDLKISIDPEVPNLLMVDPIRLKQILINLVQNAIKFTEKGFVEVQVSFSLNEDGKTGELSVQIIDSGIGISIDNIQRIFKAFEQGQQLKARHSVGSGLGLTIVNQLLHSMNSMLEVSSVDGQGSSFYFYLPVGVVDVSTSSDLAVYDESDPYESISKPCTILIAEDQEMNLLLLQTMMNRKYPKAKILTARNGEEALQMCLIQKPNILLTDVHMPLLNGFDMIRKYNELLPNHSTHIVVLTAGITGNEEMLCAELGVEYFLSKPVLPERLFSIIHEIKTKIYA